MSGLIIEILWLFLAFDLEHALSTVSKNIVCRNNLSTVSKKESRVPSVLAYGITGRPRYYCLHSLPVIEVEGSRSLGTLMIEMALSTLEPFPRSRRILRAEIIFPRSRSRSHVFLLYSCFWYYRTGRPRYYCLHSLPVIEVEGSRRNT
jgi:hypothetical protein